MGCKLKIVPHMPGTMKVKAMFAENAREQRVPGMASSYIRFGEQGICPFVK